ncbi:MAG TPA: hypothetical protein VJ775_06035 [Sphingomicrobium sp.]|nr:hypothetical protein [Sphingomicrobium sp.]
MKTFTFRLTDNDDPEERLEEAALWKAMHDVYGARIAAVTDGDADYGRPRRFARGPSMDLAYWTDPAFLKHAGRRFWVGRWEDADEQVRALHADGLGAFIKSTRAKDWICKVPVGQSLDEVADAMAYSYIDGGPPIMVQELAKVRYEHRFFVIDRRIVTRSPNAAHLTPLDFPQTWDFETPRDHKHSLFSAGGFLMPVAEDIARNMATPDAVIDCALINGEPACVEINPMVIGGVGLFACDVRAIAGALYARDAA